MTTPTEQLAAWLAALDGALSRGNWHGATALFHEDSYWRDLSAFTWNIKTMEGREAICGMLEARGADTSACGWTVEGDATLTEAGITEG